MQFYQNYINRGVILSALSLALCSLPASLLADTGKITMDPLSPEEVKSLYLVDAITPKWYSKEQTELIGNAHSIKKRFETVKRMGITREREIKDRARRIILAIKQILHQYVPTRVTLTNSTDKPRELNTLDIVTAQRTVGLPSSALAGLFPKIAPHRLYTSKNYIKYGIPGLIFALIGGIVSGATIHCNYWLYGRKTEQIVSIALGTVLSGGLGTLLGHVYRRSREKRAQFYRDTADHINRLKEIALHKSESGSNRRIRTQTLQPGQSFTDIWLVNPAFIGKTITVGSFTGFIE